MRQRASARIGACSLLIGAIAALGAVQNDSAGPARGDRDAELATEALKAHNRIRADADLPPLAADAELVAAALAHAQDMAAHREMRHEGTDGSTPAQRLDRRKYPYRSMGENVARGQPTVALVMKGWMDSPGHRENILGAFERAGIALARDDKGVPYWSVEFATTWPNLDPVQATAEVLQLINRERTTAHRKTLVLDRRLGAVAAAEARGLADAKSLGDPADRSEAFQRSLRKSGYAFSGIILLVAAGQPRPADLVRSWIEREQDRANLLGAYVHIGVGYARDSKGAPFWCVLLARPLRD